jgi:AcrR family transcriptional regulator
VESRGLEHRTHVATGLCELAVRAAVDQRSARSGLSEAEKAPERRRLSGPVRAKESGHLSRRRREAQVLDRPNRAEGLGERLDLDHAASRWNMASTSLNDTVCRDKVNLSRSLPCCDGQRPCRSVAVLYRSTDADEETMPKLWTATIDTHRRQVHEAVLDAAAELIAEQGPMSLSMSAIAERAGIGRATLYKYFPDVESILLAWHARDFSSHLQRLAVLAERDDVSLTDLAEFVRELRGAHAHNNAVNLVESLAHFVAASEGGIRATIEREVVGALTTVMSRLAQKGEVRADQDPEVLVRWLLHAVHAPARLDDHAVSELVIDSLAPRTAWPRKRRSKSR